MATSLQNCVSTIVGASGGMINEFQAMQALEEMLALGNAKRTEKGIGARLADIEKELYTALNKAIDQNHKAALVAKRNTLLSARAKTRAELFLNQFPNEPARGLEALMVGEYGKPGVGRKSIHAQAMSYEGMLSGQFINSLRKNDLLDIFSSGKFEKDIIRELWNIDKVGVTDTPSVSRQIAERINNLQHDMVRRLNRAGASISTMKNFVHKQNHNQRRILNAGYEKWARDVSTMLPDDFDFGKYTKKEFLKDAYEGLSSGVFVKATHSLSDDVGSVLAFEATSNIGDRLSKSRELRFKDADSFIRYNELYGGKNLQDSVMASIAGSSRALALMETLGPNPELMLQTLTSELRSKHKSDAKILRGLDSKRPEKMLGIVDGSASIPGNINVAHMSSGIRMVQNMAKLGSSVLSSVTDIPAAVSNLRTNGVGLLDGYVNQLSGLFQGRRSGEVRAIADLIGVGLDGMRASVASRFSAHDSLPGAMTKLQQKFFTLNTMNWWNDTNLTSAGLMLSHNLARHKGNFEGMPRYLKENLASYGITPDEFKYMSKHVIENAEGRDYFVPNKLRELAQTSDSIHIKDLMDVYGLKNVSANDRLRMVDSLVSKFSTYITDNVYSAIPHPDAKVRYITTGGGLPPGTLAGEAFRFMAQFKSFPLAYGRRVFQPAFANRDWMGLGHLFIATTVFGALAQSLKMLVRGQTPPDYTDPKNVMAAMVQGGGWGIYGDFLFGEFNRYGSDLGNTLLGPTYGQAADLAKAYAQARDGKFNAGMMWRMILNNLPAANLWYTRAAFDFTVGYNTMEMVNPGYKRRLKKRLREQGSSFIIEP